MENIKGIIFDYGGTIDSRGTHWSEIIWDGYRASGVEIDKDTFREAYVYAERELAKVRHIMPDDNFYVLLLKKMKIELTHLADNGAVKREAVDTLAPDIAKYCYDQARQCIEEARPTLEALYEKYPMVLVSNFYGNVESVLRDFNLRHYFKDIIESAVVGVRKPDPRIFGLGVEALHLKPEEVLKVALPKGKGWTADEDAVMHPSIIKKLADVLDAAL